MRSRILKRNKHIRLKEKRIIQRIVFTVISFFSLFGLVVWGAHNQNIRIANIHIEGNSAVLDKDIKDRVLLNINDKYLQLFPKDNILIYPKRKIKQDILNAFKRIYYIKINTADLTSIVITVKERDPYALWCGENILNNKRVVSNPCFFMDNTGFVFARAPNFSDDVYFTIYGKLQKTSVNQNNLNDPIGQHFLKEKYFTRLMSFRNILLNEGIDIAYLVLQDNDDIELHITTGGKLIFAKEQDIEKIFHNLVSAIEAKQVNGENVFNNLEYIDLRFNNKVLFKFSK